MQAVMQYIFFFHRCSTSHQWLQMVAPNINMKQTSRCSPCTESCKRRKPSVWIWRCILLSLIVYRLIFQRLEAIASMLLVKRASCWDVSGGSAIFSRWKQYTKNYTIRSSSFNGVMYNVLMIVLPSKTLTDVFNNGSVLK